MRKNNVTFNALSIAIVIAFLPVTTRGGTIQVTTESDSGTDSTCTLRQAVASFNATSVAGTGCVVAGTFGTSDTVTFASAVTAISLADVPNNSVVINSAHDLTLQGTGVGGVAISRPSSAINRFGIIRSSNSQCTLSLSGVSINNGYAANTTGGGGVYAAGDFIADNSIISGNVAKAPGTGTTHGGGIVASNVTLTNSVVSGNQQLGYGTGGGVFASTVTLSGSRVTGNSAVGVGGGVDATSSVVAMQSVVDGNSGQSGGGILSPAITIEYSTVSNNVASEYGGGLSGAVTVSNSTVSGNSATGGGGISAYTAHITDSTISSNTASNYGGGIFASKVFLSNSTVTANTIAQGQSAGIAIGYIEAVPSLSLISSIVSKNGANSGDFDIASHKSLTPTGDHNLIGTTVNVAVASLTNSVSGDPQLGPLANNGGATLTHALPPTSPAIHAGSNPQNLQTDQRGIGFARQTDGLVDIGAFQLQDEIFKNGFE